MRLGMASQPGTWARIADWVAAARWDSASEQARATVDKLGAAAKEKFDELLGARK